MSENPSDSEPPAGRRARAVAFELLRAVLRRHQPLDEALQDSRELARLSPRDRAFARHLTATALRRLGQVDDAVGRCLERPLKAKLGAVHDLLRLGAAQLLFLETPDHAAVDATVGLARGIRVEPHKALVNAVLRRLAREKADILAAQDPARLNTPGWLWQAWTARFGEATARAIAEAHLAEPPLDLTAKADPDAWAERLGARLLPGGSLRLPPGTGEVTRLPGYREGAWWVQDAGAALPARLLGDIDGRRVLDLCAAPGGKTAQLAAAGAVVLAVDRAPERMRQLAGNLARLSLAAATVAADITDWQPPDAAELILLDAPCTATGTLRRHPDIARLKSPDDVAAMAEMQARLLAAAARMLAPDGTLVYAVCSLQPEEGPQQIDRLLAADPGLARVPVGPEEVGGLAEAITAEGDLQTLPCHWPEAGGLDGFYACRLRRR